MSAEAARVQKKAEGVLDGVDGQGNAAADVSVTGLWNEDAPDLRGALVKVRNSSDGEAFVAVRIEFTEKSGKVRDSLVLGFEDVPAGRTVTRRAISEEAAGAKTFPRVAQAQRD